MQHKSYFYWIIDGVFLLNIILSLVHLKDADISFFLPFIVGLGMTIIHQVYDEKMYFKGMFDQGRPLNIMMFTFFRWLLTIFAVIVFIFLTLIPLI